MKDLETFAWMPRVKPTGDIQYRVRSAQFGDGYRQVAGDGLNPRSQQWELEFIGTTEYIGAIKNFLDRHAGTRAFQWQPPDEALGLFRCEEFKPTPLGGGNSALSAQFIQAFRP